MISLLLCFSREQCYVKQFAMFILDVSFCCGPLNPAAAPLLSQLTTVQAVLEISILLLNYIVFHLYYITSCSSQTTVGLFILFCIQLILSVTSSLARISIVF